MTGQHILVQALDWTLMTGQHVLVQVLDWTLMVGQNTSIVGSRLDPDGWRVHC